MLMKHGLPGLYRFRGGSGTLGFLRQAGCIQLVPVDVCGKNAELTLQSRVKGFTKQTLDDLLTGSAPLVWLSDLSTLSL